MTVAALIPRPDRRHAPPVAAGLAGLVLAYCVRRYVARQKAKKTVAPRPTTATPGIWSAPRHLLASDVPEADRPPYTPADLPGGRVVDTPYGRIQVYEWGPEEGDKVLLIPGISTPVLAMGNMGHDLVSRGYRVMMFDLFGRGWSDAPIGVHHDIRLYVTQILLVVSSSPLSWTGARGFHLMGYSFGGCISAAFTRHLPQLVRSLTLITGGGLLRRSHISWKSRILYSRGVFPPWLLETLVRRRLQTTPSANASSDDAAAESSQSTTLSSRFSGNSDATGGDKFDYAVLVPSQPHVTVAAVCSWQLTHHPGYIPSFMSSLRDAPIYEEHALWAALAEKLTANRLSAARGDADAGVGKVLLVLGSTDQVVVKEEVIPDTKAVLGEDAVEVSVIDGGHEIPITESTAIVEAAIKYWSE